MGVLDKFLDGVRRRASEYGYTCDGCENEIFVYPDERLCQECDKKIIKNDKITCVKCGRAAKTTGVCLDCKSRLPKFTVGLSAFVYEGYVCSLLNRLKNGDRYLSFYFGERLAKYYLQKFPNLQQENLLVVCVPLTNQKHAQRGYNQSQEIAKAFVAYLAKHELTVPFDKDVLQKRRDAPPQKTLSKAERFQNVQGLFHVHKRKACRDKTVILIDDILTTGATGSECANLLLSAGAKQVHFLACASLQERS